MAKKAAVVAVNPVNGMGLFQYLETFFENKIPCTVFAVAESREIRTNSGIGLTADDVIANLKGHEEEYDALVLACGGGGAMWASPPTGQRTLIRARDGGEASLLRAFCLLCLLC